MFNVLLVGAGQLGSRYLQGFVKSKVHLNISVVDPDTRSLEAAESRWFEAGGRYCDHKVHWTDSIPEGVKNIDLVLIVTPARGRSALVNQIASRINVRYWILEKVLAQSVSEVDVITQATIPSNGAWVNVPRRMMAWHVALREAFISKGPIRAVYLDSLWGLACNSIHFLDLISWFTGEKLSSIDTSGLDPLWLKSKRSGYFEATGKLTAHYSEGTRLELESRSETGAHSFQLQLADDTVWEIDEANGTASSSNAAQIDGILELQSELSGRLVDGVLLRGQCDLPTLEESAATHRVFLDAMLKHWNLSQKRSDQLVPIT